MVHIIAECQEVQKGLYADVIRFNEESEIYFMVDDFDEKSGAVRFCLSLEELIKYANGEKVEILPYSTHFRTEAEYCAWINRNAA